MPRHIATARSVQITLIVQIAMLAILVASPGGTASAATIQSTPAGGSWSSGSTWSGGAVPTADDDVILAGPVTVAGSPQCLSLSVLPAGGLAGAQVAPPRVLTVTGSVFNQGSITDGAYGLELQIGGDLDNRGVWTCGATTLIGDADRSIGHWPGHRLETDLAFLPGASGDLLTTTPLEVSGNVTMTGGRLVLGPDCPFTLEAGNFQGDLAAAGNEMRFESWSYLSNCTIDDVVLVGEADASFLVTFTTRLEVRGSLQNGGTGGGGSVLIEGDLVNHGTITNQNYSFNVRVTGDVENFGEISNPILDFRGDGATHHLSMGPDAVLDAMVFLPEFQPSTLVADTPLRFHDSLGLGMGRLVLEPGSSLQFLGFGGMNSGTIEANGNTISSQSNSSLGGITIDQGILDGQVTLTSDCEFTGGLTVLGDISTGNWAEARLTVHGLLRNQGSIADGITPVRVTALGDVSNEGSFHNNEVIMGGGEDQAIGVGTDFSAALILESDLMTGPYQWYRDGESLPGETGATLTLSGVGPADFGLYQCRSGVFNGRAVLVTDVVGSSSAGDLPGRGVVLEANHPNPFNPATEFSFRLERAGVVRLEVHDLAGRLVDRVFRGELPAGRHSRIWQPQGLAAGTYFYSLRTAEGTVVRKCALVK